MAARAIGDASEARDARRKELLQHGCMQARWSSAAWMYAGAAVLVCDCSEGGTGGGGGALLWVWAWSAKHGA